MTKAKAAPAVAAVAAAAAPEEEEVTFCAKAGDIERFRCSVCHSVLLESCAAPCQHFMCETCVNEIARRDGGSCKCPECRALHTRAAWIPDVRGRRDVAAWPVTCNACKGAMMFKEYAAHRGACPMRLRPCAHGCATMLLGGAQAAHDASCLRMKRTCTGKCKLPYEGPEHMHDCTTRALAEIETLRRASAVVAPEAPPPGAVALARPRKTIHVLALLGNGSFSTCDLMQMFERGGPMVAHERVHADTLSLQDYDRGYLSDRHLFLVKWLGTQGGDALGKLRSVTAQSPISVRPGTLEVFVVVSTKRTERITADSRNILIGKCVPHPPNCWFRDVRVAEITSKSGTLRRALGCPLPDTIYGWYSRARCTLTRLDMAMASNDFVTGASHGDAIIIFSSPDHIEIVRQTLRIVPPPVVVASP